MPPAPLYFRLGDFHKQIGKDILKSFKNYIFKDIMTIFKDDRIENWKKHINGKS